MMEVEPLFPTTHAALLFAFNYAHQQTPRGAMADLYSTSDSNRPKGRGLIKFDGAGEAGMITADVRRLDQAEQDVLCVRYTKVKIECRCCSQYTDTPQVREALARLEQCVVRKGETGNNLRLIRAIVRDHFGLGQHGTARVLAEQLQVSRSTVSNYSVATRKTLNQIESRAEGRLRNLLQASGKIES